MALLDKTKLLPLIFAGTSSALTLVAAYKLFGYGASWLKFDDDADDSAEEKKDESNGDDADVSKNDISPTKVDVSFVDVKGCDNAKSDLEEYIQYLRNKDVFDSVGGEISKGCLLVGPSGTGKTLLVKALAGQAKASLYDITYTDADGGTLYCNDKH